MTGRIIAASIILLLLGINVCADINTVSMSRRMGLLTLVMGTYYRYTHEEGVHVTSNGRTLDEYTVTTLCISWRRGGYEVRTTASIPMEYSIIRRSEEMFNTILSDPRYYMASTLTIRRIR